MRKGNSCGAPPRKHHGKKLKKCTRYTAVHGGFSFSGKAGANHFRFMGRLGGKALKKGSYVLYAVATNSARLKAKQASRSFKIVG